ncbi:MAG: hypothetical protein JWO19_5975 [Bryobacterales bacterium]|nr:hypothetical protein [Bryobacterales bacterium]
MKKTPETLIAICDTVASGSLSYQKAAMVCGVAPRTFWLWIKLSQQNDETLMLDFLGSRVQFAQAINAARRIALHEMRGRMEMKSVLGYDEPIFYNGMPTWQPDPVTVGWTPEEREALGFRADGLLEVDGKVVQNTVHHEPSVALQLRVAEMGFPKEYRPGISQSVDVHHSGVVGIQHAKPTNYSAGPPPVPPPPTPPQLEMLGDVGLTTGEDNTDAEPIADRNDIDLDDMLGEPDEQDLVEDQPLPPPPVVDRVIRSAPTASETSPRQEGVLAPPLSTKSIPAGWRAEWQKLQSRGASLPDKLNRG